LNLRSEGLSDSATGGNKQKKDGCCGFRLIGILATVLEHSIADCCSGVNLVLLLLLLLLLLVVDGDGDVYAAVIV
jgi:hypothetical protein